MVPLHPLQYSTSAGVFHTHARRMQQVTHRDTTVGSQPQGYYTASCPPVVELNKNTSFWRKVSFVQPYNMTSSFYFAFQLPL